MKNVLLCLLALTIAIGGYSQQKPTFRGDVKSAAAIRGDRTGWEPEKTKPIISSTVTAPANYTSSRDVNFVTVVSIGTAANAYGYGYAGGQKAIVAANNDINTVTHIHRQGGTLDPGGYSGDLAIDISTDGGMTWSNQNEIYKSTISGGTYNTDAARYPNHGIWNPIGNTDPDEAYVTFYAPTLDGSNGAGSWGGYAYGRAKIESLTTDTTKNLSTSTPPYYQYITDAYDVSMDGIIVAVDANQDWTSGSLVYQGNLIVYRGVWDDGVGDFVFDRSLMDFPTKNNDRPIHIKFAFGPDGQTGYIGIITDNAAIVPLYDSAYFYPVFIKTIDGGQTWGDPIAVRLDGPDGLYGVKNYLTQGQIDSLFNPPIPGRDEIAYTTAFDCDMAVDMWGNPHMAVVIGPGGASAYSIVTAARYFSAFDVFSTDGGTTWGAYSAGKLVQFRGTFGTDFSEDNRIQISTTQDGKKVFVTWLDTWLEGATENNAPDVFCRGIDINMPPNPWIYTADENGDDLPDNVTTFSEAMWQSYFAATARFSLSNNGTYTVPITYEQLTTPFDPTLPVQYKYIQDFNYDDADFMIVGVGENNVKNITSVSQNYPNPFSSTSTVVVNLTEKANLKLVVTNLIGQQMMQIERGDVAAGQHEFVIDGSKLSNGIYFYTVYAGKESVTRKMIVE